MLEPQAQLDLKAFKVCKVMLVLQDRKAYKEFKVYKVM